MTTTTVRVCLFQTNDSYDDAFTEAPLKLTVTVETAPRLLVNTGLLLVKGLGYFFECSEQIDARATFSLPTTS